MNTANLWVAFIGDGYLYGATKNGQGANNWYWPHEVRHDPNFSIVFYLNVPQPLADNLCCQGTSDQVFGDGYLAQNALAMVNTESVEVWANDPEDFYTCDFCGESYDAETWNWYGGCVNCSLPDDEEEDDEPYYDDTVYLCPDCERPQQFPGLCPSCKDEELRFLGDD